jgi:hypothetical protein
MKLGRGWNGEKAVRLGYYIGRGCEIESRRHPVRRPQGLDQAQADIGSGPERRNVFG